MITLLLALLFLLFGRTPANPTTLFDFRQSSDTTQWTTIDDGVMGGVSQSTWVANPNGTAVFSGTVSLDNNGGFSSVRSNSGKWDVSGFTGIALHVTGDSKRYTFYMRDVNNGRILYSQAFTTSGQPEVIQLPFSAFEPQRFGVTVSATPLNLTQVVMFGFIISDKQAGEFRLEIQGIGLYK